MSGNLGHVTRLARADEERALQMADRLTAGRDPDLELARLEEVARVVIPRGDRLNIVIRLPGGRLLHR